MRVSRTEGGDGVLSDACLALEMSYPNDASMKRALASPECTQKALETETLLAMVQNPTVSHAVFDVAESS